MPKVEIEVKTPKVIDTHYGYFPFMYRLASGDLFLKAYSGLDGSLPEAQYEKIYAEPEGKTTSSDEFLREDLARGDDTMVSNEVMNWNARSTTTERLGCNAGRPWATP